MKQKASKWEARVRGWQALAAFGAGLWFGTVLAQGPDTVQSATFTVAFAIVVLAAYATSHARKGKRLARRADR